MLIDIRQLLSGDTDKIAFDYTFSLTEGDFPFDTAIDDVVYTSPVQVKGGIVNMGGYMRLDAGAVLTYDTCCARCLKPLSRSFEISLSRTAIEQGKLENTSEEEADDYIEIVGGMLDLDSVIAEELLMSFPVREICSEECKGLCPKCGRNLNEGECSCEKKEIDPRLAVLAQLLEDK